MKLKNVKISYVCGIFPSKKVQNIDNPYFDEITKGKIIHLSEIKERYVLNRDANETMMSLYKKAGLQTIEKLGWKKEEVKGVIVVSQSHEYRFPSTAVLLQDELGLSKDCFAYDVVMGCSGYIYGLFCAMSHLNENCDKILMFVGDSVNDFIYSKNRSVAFLFSDAASCTALEYASGFEADFIFETDGSGRNAIIVPHGGSAHPICEDSFKEYQDEDGNINIKSCMEMKGLDVFVFICQNVPNVILKLLRIQNLEVEDISSFFLHQANYYALIQIRKKLKIKNECLPLEKNYGNTSSASIAILLAEEKSCQKSNVIMAGFGVGLSIGVVFFNKLDFKSELLFA
ncbi:ketoacyl-ACP synthase III [Campylobacter taeniopygiae]|uniref:3-ketoacyl-ACP synthase n=1 Tax=Campylobacter taeniopygiae TaxID=2510188 RepID=A0ABY2TJS2_9BACT|nr:ketoacyl-ACP synthase III [Campylobacter taeniopygiae]TKX34350.1 3-ketoacyl-ACP synthase [Campylobacter taeniopygiae]